MGPPTRAKQAFPGPVLLHAEALGICGHLRNLGDLTVHEGNRAGKQELWGPKQVFWAQKESHTAGGRSWEGRATAEGNELLCSLRAHVTSYGNVLEWERGG